MMQRYFFLEPLYSDPETFCNITVGSGRVRANIQIYIREDDLLAVAWALRQECLVSECPRPDMEPDFNWFGFFISVVPSPDARRIVRFRICQGMIGDGAPFLTEIRFWLTERDSLELASEIEAWVSKPEYLLHFTPCFDELD